MSFLWFLITMTVLVWAYILVIRPALRRFPLLAPLWTRLDPAELWLWNRSRSILGARLYWVGGIAVAVHETGAKLGLDWTPLVQQIGGALPDQYQGLVLAMFPILTGFLFEWLRRTTVDALASKRGD